MGEEIEVRTRCSRIGTKSFDLEHVIAAGDRVVAEAKSVLVAYDYGLGASVPISDELRRALRLDAGRERAVRKVARAAARSWCSWHDAVVELLPHRRAFATARRLHRRGQLGVRQAGQDEAAERARGKRKCRDEGDEVARVRRADLARRAAESQPSGARSKLQRHAPWARGVDQLELRARRPDRAARGSPRAGGPSRPRGRRRPRSRRPRRRRLAPPGRPRRPRSRARPASTGRGRAGPPPSRTRPTRSRSPSHARDAGGLAPDLVDHRQRLVDRDREADVLGRAERRGRRVDPDQAPRAVDERAAGVAGVDRRVGLEQSLRASALRLSRPFGRAPRRSPASRSGRRSRAGSRARSRDRRAAATTTCRARAARDRSPARGSRRDRARARCRSPCPRAAGGGARR